MWLSNSSVGITMSGIKKKKKSKTYSSILIVFISRALKPFKAYWLHDTPTGLTFNNCVLFPPFIYVLRTNSDMCHLQHKLIGFYNRDEKGLQRGTDWAFK